MKTKPKKAQIKKSSSTVKNKKTKKSKAPSRGASLTANPPANAASPIAATAPVIIEHPILQHKLGVLRNKSTNSYEFRNLFSEISMILTYEATRDILTQSENIETPISKTKSQKVTNPPLLACVMRAGTGMLDGALKILPFAKVGHIGIYRDRQLNATVEYYFKLPRDVRGKNVLLLDPLLATGDTALAALERLKQYQVGQIKLLTLLASTEGLKRIAEAYPDVLVYTLSIEKNLDARGHLVPGVGDAGDRLFGTV